MKLKFLVPFPLLGPFEKGLGSKFARDLVGWAVSGLDQWGKAVQRYFAELKNTTASPLGLLFTMKPENILTANRS